MKRMAQESTQRLLAESRAYAKQARENHARATAFYESQSQYVRLVHQYLLSRTALDEAVVTELVEDESNQEQIQEGMSESIDPSHIAFRLAFYADVEFDKAGIVRPHQFIQETPQPRKH